MATIYVSNLDFKVTEDDLFEAFKSVGTIDTIFVCRDKFRKFSLGRAYINFNDIDSAKRGLEMAFNCIHGREMHVKLADRDPSKRRSGVGNVFVKNLDKTIDNKSFLDTFSVFGDILSSKICQDYNGVSKGFGYIQFSDQGTADQCIKEVDGMLIKGNIVSVQKYLPRKDRLLIEKVDVFTNVYVKNFDMNLTENDLAELFKPFGKITSLCIAKMNNIPQGFGFVNFADTDSAKNAIKCMNGTQIGERILFVDRAQIKGERHQKLRRHYNKIARAEGSNIYLKNLEDEIDEERLRQEFSRFGSIKSIKLMMENNRFIGVAYICFATGWEAADAVATMNHKILIKKPIFVAIAQKKEERRAFLTEDRKNVINRGMYLTEGGYYIPIMPQHQTPHQQPSPQQQQNPQPQQTPQPQQILQQERQQQPQSQQQRQRYVGPHVRTTTAPVQTKPKVCDVQEKALEKEDFFKMLAGVDPAEQKQMIGERLYRLVERMVAPQLLVSKITGMLLELENPDLLDMLENFEFLKSMVQEAIVVLDEDDKKRNKIVETK